MTSPARALRIAATTLPLAASPILAQASDSLATTRQWPVYSIGQPRRWQPALAALATHDASGTGATISASFYRALLNPVTGAAGFTLEGYGTVGGAFAGGGARALATSRIAGLSTGADFNLGAARRGRVDWVLSFQTAIRRGGLLGHGTMLRADWLPTRGRSFALGITLPVLQPLAGRTRPRATTITIPGAGAPAREDAPLPPAAERALSRLDNAAHRLAAYTVLWRDDDVRLVAGGSASGAAADPHAYDATMHGYLASLDAAFAAVVGDSTLAAVVARRARAGLFDHVLVAYDSLFGQVKSPDDVAPLLSTAQRAFDRWLADSSRVPAAARASASRVHARWLALVGDVHREQSRRTRDSRTVWLPLRLALAPEDHDEQSEVDSIVGRLVDQPFTDQNAISYITSTDLPLEIARSIFAARRYHVLWTHDFAGTAEGTRALDNISYEMVADVYLPALTAAVKRYDATGTMPVYMIVLDEFWYEVRDARRWMTILRDPLGAPMTLPGHPAEQEAHLRQRQGELRAAVAASARLQRDAVGAGGASWLRRIVGVSVNVTNPADFSFRSRRIVPPLPFTPDDVMRDHRKMVLYDYDERDPYGGAMMLMGIGVGEQYASATWEDRGYRLRGPAALEARAALRRVLRANGFGDADIPAPLREVRDTKTAQRNADQRDYVGRAVQLHNETGFGRKESSVGRAALYDLASSGSVIIVPDPLWVSPTWGAMLAGAAARGAQVQVIVPALANAPSPQGPVMAQAHDVMTRLLALRAALDGRLRASGGALRVGVFAGQAEVNDVAGRRREVREGLARAPWIRQLVPFDSATLAVLDRAQAQTTGGGGDATPLTPHQKPQPPKLHQKTQLFARPGAIAVLVRQPGWDVALADAMESQSRQTANLAAQLGYETPAIEESAVRSTDAMLRGYEAAVPEPERKRFSFYFAVGSQNEDPRGLMSDGEAMVLTSGFQGATGLVDLYYLMARSTWVRDRKELEVYLPPPSRLSRILGRLLSPSL